MRLGLAPSVVPVRPGGHRDLSAGTNSGSFPDRYLSSPYGIPYIPSENDTHLYNIPIPINYIVSSSTLSSFLEITCVIIIIIIITI